MIAARPFLLAVLLLLAGMILLPAQVTPADSCPVCLRPLGSKVYRLSKRGGVQKIFICVTCARLDTACYICGIPVMHRFTQLADGRILCEEDARAAVFSQDEAERIFEDVKRDAQSMLARLGSLPDRNIQLILEQKARLDKTGANLISMHDDRLLMGLTRTRSTRETGFEHTIYLLHGLTRERLLVVAAHEYAHTWLHENVRRKLNADCVEGFCDWVAYHLIIQKSAPHETRLLLESRYSQGQLQAFIAAEKEHSFERVIQWVRNGRDPEIDPDHLEQILDLREAPVIEPGSSLPLVVAPRPAPTTLTLKGLSGTTSRRFALINDRTLEPNESGKVRLGLTNVVVRCVEIGNDFAVVECNGERLRLTLNVAP